MVEYGTVETVQFIQILIRLYKLPDGSVCYRNSAMGLKFTLNVYSRANVQVRTFLRTVSSFKYLALP